MREQKQKAGTGFETRNLSLTFWWGQGVGVCVHYTQVNSTEQASRSKIWEWPSIRRIQHIILHKLTGKLNLPVYIDRCKCTSSEMHMHKLCVSWSLNIATQSNSYKPCSIWLLHVLAAYYYFCLFPYPLGFSGMYICMCQEVQIPLLEGIYDPLTMHVTIYTSVCFHTHSDFLVCTYVCVSRYIYPSREVYIPMFVSIHTRTFWYVQMYVSGGTYTSPMRYIRPSDNACDYIYLCLFTYPLWLSGIYICMCQ